MTIEGESHPDPLEHPTLAVPVTTVDRTPLEAAPLVVEAPHPPNPPVVPVQTVVAERPRYVYGNPFGYALRRFGALAIDLVLPIVAISAVLYSQISINPLTGLPTGSQGAFDSTVGIAAAITLGYLVLAQAIFGTTLGKLFFNLHVYARRGGMVGFGRAVLRTLLLPLDLLAIGFVLAVLPGHRRLGDLLGGTFVARSPLNVFAPLLGAIGILVVGAAPFVLAGGPDHVFATLAAFAGFGPHLVVRLAQLVLDGIAAVGGGGFHLALPGSQSAPAPVAPVGGTTTS